MFRKLVFPLILGIFGVTVLSGLGVWQLKRLGWKTEILENIQNKITAEPVKLTEDLKKQKDQYLSVAIMGEIQPQEIHVLTSVRNLGPGFLVISPLKLRNGRLIMVDKGFIPHDQKNVVRSHGPIKLIGNLLWPNEIDSFTPEPNIEKNIWFGRELDRMSDYLGTEPVLVVARTTIPKGAPLPQKIGLHIANDHLSYAVTWFSLACIWFGMTILLVYRIKKYRI